MNYMERLLWLVNYIAIAEWKNAWFLEVLRQNRCYTWAWTPLIYMVSWNCLWLSLIVLRFAVFWRFWDWPPYSLPTIIAVKYRYLLSFIPPFSSALICFESSSRHNCRSRVEFWIWSNGLQWTLTRTAIHFAFAFGFPKMEITHRSKQSPFTEDEKLQHYASIRGLARSREADYTSSTDARHKLNCYFPAPYLSLLQKTKGFSFSLYC